MISTSFNNDLALPVVDETAAMMRPSSPSSSSSDADSAADDPVNVIGVDPLLSQAAVSAEQVESNDALLRVTDTVALETIAVAVPAEILRMVDAEVFLGGSVAEEGKEGEAPGENGEGAAVINLDLSVRDFVDKVTDDDVPVSDILPPSAAEEILAESGLKPSVLSKLDDPAVVGVVGEAIVKGHHRRESSAVVAEFLSGEFAEAANLAPSELPVAAIPANKIDSVATHDSASALDLGKIPEDQQPVSYLIARHPVWIAQGFPTPAEIDESIAHLDRLIAALRSVEQELFTKGLSPGFETRSCSRLWRRASAYETLPSVNSHTNQGPAVPVPSAAAAVRYYEGIRDTWVQRKQYVEAIAQREGEGGPEATTSSFCSCIREWDHSGGNVLEKLTNQSLEQEMVREASDVVTVRLSQPGCMRGEAWDRLYDPEHCPRPESVGHLYVPRTRLRLLGGRDEYLATFARHALRARSTIDLATCYIFPHDPAHRYILLDLLPHVARTRGVKVRLLCDMMPIESSIMKSAIKSRNKYLAAAQQQQQGAGAATGAPPALPAKHARSGYCPLSFLECLPSDAPPMSDDAKHDHSTPMEFITKVLQRAFAVPDELYQVKWWCARDSQERYRIKNHAKCAVFDGNAAGAGGNGRALMGGSNICPTVESGDSDLDLLVGGSDAVRRIWSTFEWLWDCMCDAQSSVVCTDIIVDTMEPPNPADEEDEDDDGEPGRAGKFPREQWLDASSRVALVRSEPCSAGSDAIFRHVLGAIAAAKESVYMCMGHSNKPMALAKALGDAVRRGVRVQLLVNSIYSCDLRVNQRDLFRSIQNLLMVAPGVEVWTTALRSHRIKAKASSAPKTDSSEEKKDDDALDPRHDPLVPGSSVEEGGEAPPFLHSKYTVVDGKWVAVGSWNVWTRSAFYEIEHELLIESETVARQLENKFEKEKQATSVLLRTPEECAMWCPSGCKLCMPFGPFYT